MDAVLQKSDLVDRLKARIRWLEGLLLAHEEFIPPEWGMRRMERRLMGALLSRRLCPVGFLIERAYLGEAEPGNAKATIEARLSKMRRRLDPYGIKISVLRGVGYQLEPPPGKIISAAISQQPRGGIALVAGLRASGARHSKSA